MITVNIKIRREFQKRKTMLFPLLKLQHDVEIDTDTRT